MRNFFKRLTAAVLTTGMSLACMSFPTAYAEGVLNLKIEGNPVLYDVLTAQFDYDGDKSEITYKWLVSDSVDGEYSEITDTCIDEAGKIRLLQETDWGEKEYTVCNTSVSDTVVITPTVAAGQGASVQGKYIKVILSDPEGVSYESAPVYIEESWGGKELLDGAAVEGARNTTDPNYVFSVDGQEFILLDTFENDDSGHYLVMAKDTYGVRPYFMTDQSQRPYEMAYWLNHTFKDNGIDGKKLPEEIVSHIDYDRYWRVEQGTWWHAPGTFENGGEKTYRHVSVQGGIMLPSYTELTEYKDIIGLHDNNANWWLRTPCAKFSDGNPADGNWMMRVPDSGNALAGTHGTRQHNIRPIFALNKDFFKTVKVSDIGEAVAERIRADVTDEELKAIGYSELEIRAVFNGEALADNVRMKGIYEYYQTIIGEADLADGVSEADAEYAWLYSDTEDGSYTQIPKDGVYVTDSALTLVQGADSIAENPLLPGSLLLYSINASYAGKWIRYRVSVAGIDYMSEPRQVADIWAGESLYQTFSADDTYTPVSPAENIFTIDGQKFILLDTTESDTSKFFVLSYNDYGAVNKGSAQHFEYMSLWLNTEFKDSGVLPKAVLDGIDYNHYWKVGPRRYGRNLGDNIWYPAVKGGISLLGISEYKQYRDKIGYADELSGSWWLRDPEFTSGDGNNMMVVDKANGSGFGGNMTTTAYAVRPAFYLNNSFFTDNIIDLAEAGTNVTAVLREEYTREEMLEAGYSEQDLAEYFDKQYTVDSISVSGDASMGSELSVSYNYNGTPGTEDVRWYISDSANGEYFELATGTSVAIAFEQTEKYIKAGITVPGGEIFYSEPVYIESPYDESFEGTISQLSVAGVPEFYQQLKAAWTSEDGVTAQDIIRTEWLTGSEPAGEYTTETVGDVFYPNSTHAGKYVKVRIILKNRNTYESEPLLLSGERWTDQQGLIDNDTVKLSSVNKETPRENIFSVGGQEFILLDNKEYGYYVLSKNSVGNRVLYYCDAMGQSQSPADVMMWLNNKSSEKAFKDDGIIEITSVDYTENGYLGSGAYTQLPTEIIENINNDFFHKVERGTWWHANGFSSMSIQGGLTLLSQSELIKYADKIGLQDEEKTWWLRTPYGQGMDGNHMIAVCGEPEMLGQTIDAHAATSNYAIRPSFRLDKDFFAKAKLDFAGENVAELVRNTYSENELIQSGLYTDAELDSVFGFGGVSAYATETGAEVILTAFGGESIDVYFAAYSDDNRLLAIDQKTVVPELSEGSFKIEMTADIPDGAVSGRVFVWDKDQKNKAGAVDVMSFAPKEDTPYITLRFAGDSTVANYGAALQSGWGERLADMFDRTVITSKNYAMGGRTAAGFIEEGFLNTILSEMQPQDYLFVQFGHNEHNTGASVESYKEALLTYINSVPDKTKIIFVTPPVRRMYEADGSFIGSSMFVRYADAMREVASENGIPVVDLHTKTNEWITSVSKEESEEYYMPDDDQHFTHKGTQLLTRFIAEELERIGHPLAEYLK